MRRSIGALAALSLTLIAGAGRTQAPEPGHAGHDAAAHAMPQDMPPTMPMGPPVTLADWAKGARPFDGLGGFHRAVTTRSPEAQRYFDQGMRFLWGFNHDEATRSFAKAAALDPACAGCFWGVALTLGPNYNMPMMAQARATTGFEALRKAQALAPRATPVERALIGALSKRFNGATPLDPGSGPPVLAAYADAMREVAHRFPDDLDVQTLFAEAMMNRNPWKLWTADGKPAPGTAEIIATLERVLARDPQHPGANHYYIHAVEASGDPGRALASAERLKTMMPAAGHIVHMPSHILQRVGRYEESAEANRQGARADAAYYALTNAPDYYPMYTAHNFQFLAFSAAMEGRRAETMAAVREARKALSDDMLAGMPGIDWSVAYLYAAEIRFGLWDEVLSEPKPSEKLPGLMVGWLEARTAAFAAKGRLAEAEAALAAMERAIASAPKDYGAGLNTAAAVYPMALLKAKARLALARGHTAEAVNLLTQAVALEDRLDYNEPADAFFPARHLLGAALLVDGRAAEAEAAYREDLRRNPENGWALYGLAMALATQSKDAESTAVRARFAKAWANADVKLVASAY